VIKFYFVEFFIIRNSFKSENMGIFNQKNNPKMISQTTLLNFSKASLVKTLSSKLVLSKNNVLHTQPINCPICNCKCIYNGYSHEGNYNLLAKENEIFFKKGQQYCSTCDKTYQIQNSEFQEFNQLIIDKLKNQVYTLLELGNSESDIKYYLENNEGIKISKSNIALIKKDFFTKIENSYPELDNLLKENLEGFIGYDEQYLRIDGKRYYRLVFLNLDTNEVIYEGLHKDISKKSLIKLLKEIFKDSKPKGFVFDMKTMYVNAFKAVFGRKINLQYCIFHLHKSIMDKFNKSMKFLNKNLWTLEDYKRMYMIFNIFYDRSEDLKFIKELQFFRNFDFITSSGKTDSIDKYYIKIAKKHFHDNKLIRERKNGLKRLKHNYKVQIENNLDEILELCKIPKYFPKKVVSQLRKIKNNFSDYTGGIEYGILTNNRVEGLFGSTLKKFQKKTFNIILHFSAFLKLKKLRKKGLSLLKKIPPEKHLFAQMLIFAFQQ
jgi:transposase-like protein